MLPELETTMRSLCVETLRTRMREEARRARSALLRRAEKKGGRRELDPGLLREWAATAAYPFADRELHDELGGAVELAPVDAECGFASFRVHVIEVLGVAWRVPMLRVGVNRRGKRFQEEHSRFLALHRPGVLSRPVA